MCRARAHLSPWLKIREIQSVRLETFPESLLLFAPLQKFP